MTFIYNPFWKGAPLVEIGSVIWFILLMMHGGYWAYTELRERAIRKAIERERKAFAAQMSAPSMKSKRGSIDHLYTDEALVDLDAIDWQGEIKHKRG